MGDTHSYFIKTVCESDLMRKEEMIEGVKWGTEEANSI